MGKPTITYQQLLRYAAGELSGPEAVEIEAHLARDPDAAATVSRYRLVRATLLADDGVDPPPEVVAKAKALFRRRAEVSKRPPGLIDQVAATIARLIFDSRVQPALAGLRGPATGFQLTYELSGARLDLEVEPAEPAEPAAEGAGWRLLGQIASPRPLPAVRVALCQAGTDEPVCAVESDERGAFALDAQPGTYDLRIHLPDGVAVVPDLRIS
ncbi:MAG: anti-sigma factor family protein [Planctomycetota bacterium]|jgi:anti-sigma factor RsiW